VTTPGPGDEATWPEPHHPNDPRLPDWVDSCEDCGCDGDCFVLYDEMAPFSEPDWEAIAEDLQLERDSEALYRGDKYYG
jgi:hypothetical protein